MTEILKREMLQVQEERSLDALYGVMPSQYQPSTEMATVGPYNLANLYSSSVTSFISDPRLSSVVLCGRNELKRGNLPSVLKYVLASTGSVRNIVYADGNSTDGSAIYMEAMGITTLRRTDLLDLLDKRRFAEVLAVSEKTIEGQDVPGEIPLRKGLEVLNVQQFFLQKYLQAKSPRYLLYIDTDLKSIPGGEVCNHLTETQIYHPLQQLIMGILELNGIRDDKDTQWALFTGSGGRNNEPHFVFHNILASEANSPFLDEEQKRIAHSFFFTPSQIVHPLTGEFIVNTAIEITTMGATGQCVEIARILTLAGLELNYRNSDESLELSVPHLGNVRRGTEVRIDEPQTDEKEWWMVCAIIPQFAYVLTSYAIHRKKLPHVFDIDDYVYINNWLRKIQHSSIIDNRRQTRIFKYSPMERVIPPVTLLVSEGILKI